MLIEINDFYFDDNDFNLIEPFTIKSSGIVAKKYVGFDWEIQSVKINVFDLLGNDIGLLDVTKLINESKEYRGLKESIVEHLDDYKRNKAI